MFWNKPLIKELNRIGSMTASVNNILLGMLNDNSELQLLQSHLPLSDVNNIFLKCSENEYW
jgi:hypothetical protein